MILDTITCYKVEGSHRLAQQIKYLGRLLNRIPSIN